MKDIKQFFLKYWLVLSGGILITVALLYIGISKYTALVEGLLVDGAKDYDEVLAASIASRVGETWVALAVLLAIALGIALLFVVLLYWRFKSSASRLVDRLNEVAKTGDTEPSSKRAVGFWRRLDDELNVSLASRRKEWTAVLSELDSLTATNPGIKTLVEDLKR